MQLDDSYQLLAHDGLKIHRPARKTAVFADRNQDAFREGANKQVMSSQADSLIKISRIWADFVRKHIQNQPI